MPVKEKEKKAKKEKKEKKEDKQEKSEDKQEKPYENKGKVAQPECDPLAGRYEYTFDLSTILAVTTMLIELVFVCLGSFDACLSLVPALL